MLMKDVAAAAGVSVSTVSRVLSGSRGVKPEHHDRVVLAAERLNYRPNLVARSLRRATTRTVGILVPSIDNPFFPQLITAVERELSAQGFALLIASSSDDEHLEADRLQMLAERRVDGLLVSASTSEPHRQTLREVAARVPLVLFDQKANGVEAPFVGTDDAGGMEQLIDHLAAQGARTFAHIGGADDNWSGYQRRCAFERSIEERAGLSQVASSCGTFSREHGRRAATTLLTSSPEVDAIVCGNDLIACGVLDAADDLGIRVPDQVLLTGYDDIDVATMCKPRLTTVRQPVDELMRVAVEMLLSLKSSADGAGVERSLPVELVRRGSSVRV